MATTLLQTGELRAVRCGLLITITLTDGVLSARVGKLRPFRVERVTTPYCVDCFLAAVLG